jgi:hypothetical protein
MPDLQLAIFQVPDVLSAAHQYHHDPPGGRVKDETFANKEYTCPTPAPVLGPDTENQKEFEKCQRIQRLNGNSIR